MATKLQFRDNSYLRENGAVVVSIQEDGGIVLNQTIFYAQSGGQPGDRGRLRTSTDQLIPIANTVYSDDKSEIVHGTEPGDWHLEPGEQVICELDWKYRYSLMKMHTALHLLSVCFPFPVTGGAIGANKSRLDFDMPEVPDNIEQFAQQLNDWIDADLAVVTDWINDDEMAANPELIKTMKVKPPVGQGQVRLVLIGEAPNVIDLQPCGGTHVARTGEIGPLRIGKIQKKGKQNRRVYLHLEEEK
ncbi:MAG: alanyl-tRNA editing protein [Devosiaceae bacterium]|nr:alanyl-tRNA editing protein [Devosiaceae bacterium]